MNHVKSWIQLLEANLAIKLLWIDGNFLIIWKVTYLLSVWCESRCKLKKFNEEEKSYQKSTLV